MDIGVNIMFSYGIHSTGVADGFLSAIEDIIPMDKIASCHNVWHL